MTRLSLLLASLLACASVQSASAGTEVVYRASPQVVVVPSGGGSGQTPVPVTAPIAGFDLTLVGANISDGSPVGPATLVSLKNDGTASSGIITFTLAGGTYFTISAGTCVSGTTVLAPGAGCTIGVSRKATADDVRRTDVLTAVFAGGSSVSTDVTGKASGFDTCAAVGSQCADGSYNMGVSGGFRYYVAKVGPISFTTGQYNASCPTGYLPLETATGMDSMASSGAAVMASVFGLNTKYWVSGYPDQSNGYALAWNGSTLSYLTTPRSTQIQLMCSRKIAI